MSNRVKFLLAGIVCSILACFIVPSGTFAFILMLVGVVCLFIVIKWADTGEVIEKSNAQTATAKFISYSKDTYTLTLIKRDPLIAKAVKITDARDYSIKYEPEKIHIGAVTVGGVTTGGAYTTGGYNYVAGSHKNGLCNLYYVDQLISKIQLSDELYEQAINSDIAPFVNDAKQIEVISSVPISEQEAQLAIDNMKSTGYAGNDFLNKGRPTKEKCVRIMNWMTTAE